MNKVQTKIFLTKILPIFLLITIIIIGFFGLFAGRIWGEKLQKENDEWFNDPANQSKIKKALSDNSKNTIDINHKIIRDIKVNTFDWKINAYDNKNPIDIPNLHIQNGPEEILIMSYPKKRFDNLDEFSNQQKADFIKYYAEVIPEFKERINVSFWGQKTFMDVFSININNQKINVGLINFIYKGSYYHISHYFTNKSKKVVDNIKLI